ncbi:MAG: hypothetical protein JZU63_04550 [Rhodoferax sp.]|nr:hypothetical protein [Rhodoferax sp.]
MQRDIATNLLFRAQPFLNGHYESFKQKYLEFGQYEPNRRSIEYTEQRKISLAQLEPKK